MVGHIYTSEKEPGGSHEKVDNDGSSKLAA